MALVTEPLNARPRERLLTLARDLKGDDPLAPEQQGVPPYWPWVQGLTISRPSSWCCAAILMGWAKRVRLRNGGR